MYYNKINSIWNNKQKQIEEFTGEDLVDQISMMNLQEAYKKLISLTDKEISETNYSELVSLVEQIVMDLRRKSEETEKVGIARKYFNMVEKLTDKFNL